MLPLKKRSNGNHWLGFDGDVVYRPPPVVVPLMIPRDNRATGAGRIVQLQFHALIVVSWRVRRQFKQCNRFTSIVAHQHLAALGLLPPTRVVGQE